MKIGGSAGAPAGVQPGGGRAPSSAGAGFAPALGGAGPAAAVAGPAVAAGVAGLEALLALQEAGGPLERRRRAVARANRLLDGADADAALSALAHAAAEGREAVEEPRLNGVLDEIETRAAVEMAKRESARRAA